MRKLTPKGIIGLTTTAFLFFILTSLIYFNDQVEFNAVEAKWELQDQYQIKDENINQTQQTVNYLSFDGIDDYINLGTLENVGENQDTLEIEWTMKSTDTADTFIMSNLSYLNGGRQFFYFRPNLSGNRLLIFHRDNDDHYSNSDYFNEPQQKFSDGQKHTFRYVFDQFNPYLIIDGIHYTPDNVTLTGGGADNFINFNNDFILGAFGTSSNFAQFDLYQFDIYYQNQLQHSYDFTSGNGNTLTDLVGNSDATIIGPSWNQTIQITTITESAIDTYQVFENIRNNTSTVNPLGFMNTLVSIPAQAVGYYNAFTDFVTGGFGLFDIPDMTFSELADTWWARLPIIYDKFNERYAPLGD